MGAEKRLEIGRGTLRALNHAQGQLVESHKDILLFMALDILDHIVSDIAPAGLAENCPQAIKAHDELLRLRNSARRRSNLFPWDMNGAMSNAHEALKEIASYAKEMTQTQSDASTHRKAWLLSETMADYMDMAEDIRTGVERGAFKRATKINPYISASLVAEYIQIVADRFDEMAKPSKCLLYIDFGAKLRGMASRIRNNIPEQTTPLYNMNAVDIGPLRNMMSLMSKTADMTLSFNKAAQNLGDADPVMLQSLSALFTTTAVYDWQQYETDAPANNNDHAPESEEPESGSGKVLQFRPR